MGGDPHAGSTRFLGRLEKEFVEIVTEMPELQARTPAEYKHRCYSFTLRAHTLREYEGWSHAESSYELLTRTHRLFRVNLSFFFSKLFLVTCITSTLLPSSLRALESMYTCRVGRNFTTKRRGLVATQKDLRCLVRHAHSHTGANAQISRLHTLEPML